MKLKKIILAIVMVLMWISGFCFAKADSIKLESNN